MLLDVAFIIGAFIFIIDNDVSMGIFVAAAAVIMIIATIAFHYNSIGISKVEALQSVGIEPLSNEQVYEMSKKELDECKVVNTLGETYYFIYKD